MSINAYKAKECVMWHGKMKSAVNHNSVHVKENAVDEPDIARTVRVMALAVTAHGVVYGIESHLGVELTRLAINVDAVEVIDTIGDVARLLNLK